jgi:hypothetical protein
MSEIFYRQLTPEQAKSKVQLQDADRKKFFSSKSIIQNGCTATWIELQRPSTLLFN